MLTCLSYGRRGGMFLGCVLDESHIGFLMCHEGKRVIIHHSTLEFCEIQFVILTALFYEHAAQGMSFISTLSDLLTWVIAQGCKALTALAGAFDEHSA